MATFKFKKPQDPFQPWHTKNGILNIPARPGVYIWGYWVEYQETNGKRVRKFCPINVGQAENLSSRLLGYHYAGNLTFETNNSRRYRGEKEIFGFASIVKKKDLENLYNSAINYDKRSRRKKCQKSQQCGCYFCDSNLNKGKLIFIQKLDRLSCVQKIALRKARQKHNNKGGNIKLFDVLNTSKPSEYKNLLLKHQEFHRKNFYCIYIENQGSKVQRENLETQLKKLLREELGIGTTARGFDTPIVDEFDLTVVRKDLVTLAQGRIEEKYVNRVGNYHSRRKLILPKPSK